MLDNAVCNVCLGLWDIVRISLLEIGISCAGHVWCRNTSVLSILLAH
jgi:hypothetical protein